MKIQSLILASMLSLAGTATLMNTAFADTPAATSVTATCNDGTSFTGTTKQGACSVHILEHREHPLWSIVNTDSGAS